MVGAFNAVTGELDITLDADADTATIGVDGANLTLNGSKDIDPVTVGSQEVLLTDLKIIDIDGDNTKTGQIVALTDSFTSANANNLTDVFIDDVGTANLTGTYELDGNLTINLVAGGGGIADGGTGSFTVTGTTTIDSDANDVDLSNTTHDFQGDVNITAGGGTHDVSISDANDLSFSGLSVSGDLTVTAGGTITDTNGSTLAITGTASFQADDGNAVNTNNAITLGDNVGDTTNFGKLTIHTVDTATVTEDSDSELIGTSVVGALNLTSSGAITDEANASLTVTNTLNVSGTSVTLGDTGTDTLNAGSLTFNSAGAVSVTDNGAMELIGVSTADSASLTATAGLTDEANASVTITNNLSVTGTSITLGDTGTDALNSGSLTFNTSGAVAITDDAAIAMLGTSTADSATLVATGAITDEANASLTVTNNLNLSAASITLGETGTDTFNSGSLTFSSAGAVAITDNGAIQLSGANSADSAALSATGALTNAAAATLAVTNNGSFTGDTVTLGDQAGDTINVGTLTFNSANAVQISEDSQTDLDGTSTAGTLNLVSAGDLLDNAFNSLTVTGAAFFDSNSGTGTLNLGDTVTDTLNLGSFGANANSVTIVEDSATHLDGITAATLSVSSTDLITQSGTDTGAGTGVLDVTGNASFLLLSASGDIQLVRASSNPPGAVNDGAAVDNNIGGSVTVAGVDGDLRIRNVAGSAGVPIGLPATLTNFELQYTNAAIQVKSIEVTNDLIIESGGAITDSVTANIKVGNNAIFKAGTDLTLGGNVPDSLIVTNNAHFHGPNSITVGTSGTVNLGSVTFTSNNHVQLIEDSATVLEGTSTAGSLDLTSTGSITDSATASTTVTGHTDLSATSVTLGETGTDVLHTATLNFNSAGAVSFTSDSNLQVTGANTTSDLTLGTSGALSNAAAATIAVTNHAALSGGSIAIGNQAGDAFNADTLSFNSTGAVVISEDSATQISGTSTALSLDLDSLGEITDAAGSSIEVLQTVELNANGGADDIILGEAGGSVVRFAHTAGSVPRSLSLTADDAYLKTTSNINFANTTIAGSLFVEAQNGAILDGITQAGHITQVAGTTIQAPQAGFISDGTVQLSSTRFNDLAIDSNGSATLTGGLGLNSVTDASILGDPFGAVVRNQSALNITEVTDPLGFGGTITGVNAAGGHIYLDSIAGTNLTISKDVHLQDAARSMTLVAGNSLQLVPGTQLTRGAQGVVTTTNLPLIVVNPSPGATSFVEFSAPAQDVTFNYGVNGDLQYWAQISWADGTLDTYTPAEMAAGNPNSGVDGDANPAGQRPSTLSKKTAYNVDRLLEDVVLTSTLFVYNDAGINLYEANGNTNLNVASQTFTALVAIDNVSLPKVAVEPFEPKFHLVAVEDAPDELIESNSQQQTESEDIGQYVVQELSELYSVLISGDAELRRYDWGELFTANQIDEIKDRIIEDPNFQPGIYSIRRTTPDGVTEELDVFFKRVELESENLQLDSSSLDKSERVVFRFDAEGQLAEPSAHGTAHAFEVKHVPVDQPDPATEATEASAEEALDLSPPVPVGDLEKNRPLDAVSAPVVSAMPLSLTLLAWRRRRRDQNATEQAGLDSAAHDVPLDADYSKAARRQRRLR